MAYVTYDFKVPYTTRDNAGTRYMTVQAPDNTEAMELVRGMVPGAIVTFPEKAKSIVMVRLLIQTHLLVLVVASLL